MGQRKLNHPFNTLDFASTSIKIGSLCHMRHCEKVWHHYGSFRDRLSSKIQLNRRKHQTISEKSKLGVSFTRGMCKPKKKFKTNMAPKCRVLVAQQSLHELNDK